MSAKANLEPVMGNAPLENDTAPVLRLHFSSFNNNVSIKQYNLND